MDGIVYHLTFSTTIGIIADNKLAQYRFVSVMFKIIPNIIAITGRWKVSSNSMNVYLRRRTERAAFDDDDEDDALGAFCFTSFVFFVERLVERAVARV